MCENLKYEQQQQQQHKRRRECFNLINFFFHILFVLIFKSIQIEKTQKGNRCTPNTTQRTNLTLLFLLSQSRTWLDAKLISFASLFCFVYLLRDYLSSKFPIKKLNRTILEIIKIKIYQLF